MSRFLHGVLASVLCVLFVCSGAASQTAARRLTTVEALRQYPGYFHLESVLLRGEFVDPSTSSGSPRAGSRGESGNRVLLRAGDHEVSVLLNEVRTVSGPVEVRGQLIDVGRLEPDDPRLGNYEGARDPERWPRPGEELVLSLTGAISSQPATTASVRALALEPWRFERQSATVIGQFRGRNLYGDLPGAPARSSYDFVLRAAEGAVWVTGLRPRGRGFDLSVDARVDTSQWLQVTGVVRRERGLVMIEAGAIAAAKPPAAEPASEEPVIAQVPLEPVDVVFSSPTEGEVDVPVDGPIRLQFSRGLNAATLAGRIRVSYVGDGPVAAGGPAALEFQTTYDAGTRALELKFTGPLERFRTVNVEVLEGIKGFDGAAVTPWTLRFSTGG